MIRPKTARRHKTAKTKRARAVKLLADEALLDIYEASAMVGNIAPENWGRYAARFSALISGVRVVRVDPKSRGRTRWLKSAVLEHIKTELLVRENDSAYRPEAP